MQYTYLSSVNNTHLRIRGEKKGGSDKYTSAYEWTGYEEFLDISAYSRLHRL